ncbi:MAG: SWIM zinc finger family protein [Chloroflexota bacterium]
MWYEYERTTPRRVKGGIKSQSQKGGFGEHWWAKRWIAVLESFNLGARLGRGRSYARSGQVVSIDITKGVVIARVQGSRPKPYKVSIRIETLSEASWRQVVEALSKEAILVAKLLAGEMPQDIEQVFDQVGSSLFPQRGGDLQTECSCPDWSNPCKHVAAVYYLLAEEFDRDPFLIFTLRGITREELLKLLLEAAEGATSSAEPSAVGTAGEIQDGAEPLSAEPAAFWGSSPPRYTPAEITPASAPAPLVKRLGAFPFWRGPQPLLDSVAPIYSRAAARGLDILLGKTEEGERE